MISPNYKIVGFVEEVDRCNGTITIRLFGLDAQTVPIDPKMPEWVLHKGCSFNTSIPFACKRSGSLDGVVWGEFTQRQNAHLTEEECIERLAKIFGSSEGE